MSEREKLAGIIGGKLITRSSMTETADAILAAGYRRTRVVTTVAELDALPVGAIVLHRGRSWQRYEPRSIGLYTYHVWQCPDGGFVDSAEGGRLILPATVLHEPEADQ